MLKNGKVEKFCQEYFVERKGTNSLKWDLLKERYGDADLTGMWVADMEFRVPDEVQKAMTKRIDHGVFGYSFTPDSYYEAFFNWQRKHLNINLEKEWVRFSTGVVNSFYWMVNIFTQENDSVIILPPVYYPFHNAVKDTNRDLVTSELLLEDERYSIDFEDFEEKIVANNVKLFLHCSPHNPAGRVWTRDELNKIFAICKKHNVLVVSDEIHQDIIFPGNTFVSTLDDEFESYRDILVVLTAPSKTFNLACLLNSHIIIPNSDLRNKYDSEIKKINQSELSIMGQIATEAAYRHGEEWYENILEVIHYNYEYLRENLKTAFPKLKIIKQEATYLLFIDLSEYVDADDTKEFIQDHCRLAVDFGEWFSSSCKSFVRLNLATHPKYIEYAVKQISDGLTNWEK